MSASRRGPSMADRRWWRGIQYLLGALVVALAVRALAGNWDAFRAQAVELRLRPGWVGLSVGAVLAAFALLIEGWRRVVVGQGQRLAYPDAARIWLLASLGKYLPGKVWAIAGAAMLAERAGVARGPAVAGALLLQALALASGLGVLLLLGPAALRLGGGATVAGLTVAGLIGAAVIVAAGSRRVMELAARRFSVARGLAPVPPAAIVAAFLANVAAWILYGLALSWLARGLFPATTLPWPTATAAFTAAYVVGLVALIAPAGVGPRESLLILLLSGAIGPKAALGLALASRIVLTLVEIGAALPFLAGYRRPPALRNRPDPR